MGAGDPILASDYAGIKLATIDRPVCRLVASGTISLSSGGTAITFTTEDFDPYGYHSTSSNTSRITPTKAGYHTFRGGAFIASSANVEAVWLKKNGSTVIPSGQREAAPSAANARGLLCFATVYMNGTTDYIEMIADPSGTVNTNQSAQFSSFLECDFAGRATNP
jgi:hypothetical protein